MTDEAPTVFEAWNAVKRDVLAVRKDERNKHQNFNFRGIDAVVNAVGPALRIHEVSVVPETTEAVHRDVTYGSNETKGRECTVLVTYRVYGPAGDSFAMQVAAESIDSGDKGTAKAMSVAYRIALLQGLTIPTDEPDPDEDTYTRAGGGEVDEPQETDWFALGWENEAEYRERFDRTKLAIQQLGDSSKEALKDLWRQNVETTPISDEMMTWWEQCIEKMAAQEAATDAEEKN